MRPFRDILGKTFRSVLSRLAASLLVAAVLARAASGQVFDRAISLPPADIELLDATNAAHLENAKRFLAERQWSEAVESIRRVEEAEPTRLVKVETGHSAAGFERYVPAAQYCQWRLAALATEAPEALVHYRRLVDSLGENWFREGEKNNDEPVLRRVVEKAFASRRGDDALLKLGDLALARGDIAAARGAWQRILPAMNASSVGTGGLSADEDTSALGVYPDSDIQPAGLHARLVLASILEGSRGRAAAELGRLKLLYPEAEGQFAGRHGHYIDFLQKLLEESAGWPARRRSSDWPTFAGESDRAKSAVSEVVVSGKPLWTHPLPRLSADRETIGAGRVRAADDSKAILGYHPVVVGQRVFLPFDAQGNSYVVALDLKSGQRLWQAEYSRGLAHRPEDDTAVEKPLEVNDSQADLKRHVGVSRYTISAHGNKLFTRMGSPVTVPSVRRASLSLAKEQGFLHGLDLTTQGKPLEGFPIYPPSNDWTFEGTPLVGEGAIYVAMRRTEGARSQLYLAAYEQQTTPASLPDDQGENTRPTGRVKWRTRICSSPTLGGGEVDQLTHLLVTQHGDHLYLNTSSGAVAALNASDGRLLWLVKYPRPPVRTGNPDRSEQHLFRDLAPCLAWNDLIIVAPADSDRIFALYAATGQIAWTLPSGVADDAVHLLGVADDTLLASGNSLYWIDALTGRLLAQFPRGKLGGEEQAAPSPRGFGRGILAGNHVWWPTRESIFVFETRPAETDFGWQPRLIREIPLAPPLVTGGNLVLSNGVLLVAGSDKILAFGP